MIVIDRLLVGGIGWVLRRVTEAASAEAFDESHLREELLAAEMRLELGEIDEAEFAAVEREIMARMREVRALRGESAAVAATRGGGDGAGKYTLESIDADVGED